MITDEAADYFRKRGFVHAEVIGRSGDRGVDVSTSQHHQ